MNFTNLFLFVAIAGAVACAVYWYQTEGTKMYDAFRRSENKPFMLDHYDW